MGHGWVGFLAGSGIAEGVSRRDAKEVNSKGIKTVDILGSLIISRLHRTIPLALISFPGIKTKVNHHQGWGISFLT